MPCRLKLLVAMVATVMLPTLAHAQETIEYYGVDAVGSVRVVFDASGSILARTDYEPFGRIASSSGNAPDRKFAGLFRDAETGFDYAEARSYQSLNGRFTAPDPIVAGLYEPQRWNRYSYSLSGPLTWVDPSGLDPELTGCGATSCSGTDSVTVVGSAGGADGFSVGGRTFGSSGATTRKNLTQNRDPNREKTHCDLKCLVAETFEQRRDELKSLCAENPDGCGPDGLPEVSIAGIGPPGGPVVSAGATVVATVAQQIQKHHAFPKYLGGQAKQVLEPLARSVHLAYHTGLDRIAPRWLGTAHYSSLAPAAQSHLLQMVGSYTRLFDARHGTNLYSAMLRNGFPK